MIRFADLFAGIGGIRLGFEMACSNLNVEAHCSFSSEIDLKAKETYEKNFSEIPQGDITQITSFPDFDVLLAGFPCQPFSHAGQHRGLDDTRGTLFFDIARILEQKRPRAFILENVRGLTTNDRGKTFKLILKTLKSLGYGVHWLLLNSCSFGVPQNRLRLFIVGTLGSNPNTALTSDTGPADSHVYKARNGAQLFPDETDLPIVSHVLQSRVPKKYHCSQEFVEMLSRVVGKDFSRLHGVRLIDYRNGNSIHSWDLGVKGICTKEEQEFMGLLIANRRKKHFGRDQDGKKLTLEQIKTFCDSPHLEKTMEGLLTKGYLKRHGDRFDPVCGNMSFEVFKFLDPNSISITLTASDAQRLGVVQKNIPRKITPRECARLQGFPDSFKAHESDICAYKQFGNSVTVPVVEAVCRDLISENADLFKDLA